MDITWPEKFLQPYIYECGKMLKLNPHPHIYLQWTYEPIGKHTSIYKLAKSTG